jgi:outer membrane protein TolC
LLDLPVDSEPELDDPIIPIPPDSDRVHWFLENAEKGSETELSRIKMEMAERSLNTTRSGMGINGSLKTSYAVGRGTVNPGLSEDQKIDTRDWQVTVDLSYPIWDGGASSAGLRSQELSFESARLEYQASQRSAKNKLAILLKRLEINQSKLALLDQELELAGRKLNDAQSRYEKGIISDKTLLENRLANLKTQKDRLTALKNYYLDLAELEKVGTP